MKIQLSGNTQSTLYIIPVFLIFYTIMFVVFGYAQGILKPLLYILFGTYIIGFSVMMLLRKCKRVLFDEDNIYVGSINKSTPLNKTSLAQIESVKDYFIYVRISYRKGNDLKSIYTIQDRKAMSESHGMHTLPGFELLWGKPNFRINQLKKLVESRKETHGNTKYK